LLNAYVSGFHYFLFVFLALSVVVMAKYCPSDCLERQVFARVKSLAWIVSKVAYSVSSGMLSPSVSWCHVQHV